MVKRSVMMAFILILVFTATACWDKLEIENNAFILGIGLDAAENPDEVEVTMQIALPEAFASEKKAEESYLNITKTVKDVASARKLLLKELNWVPNFEHCQILLIGEELGRRGIKEYMDFFYRAYDVRRRTDVAVVKGKAKDVLKLKPKSAPVPSFGISELMEQNSKYEFNMTNIGSINTLQIADTEKNDFLISRVIPDKENVEIMGGGVFTDFKLTGWLNGEEVMFTRLIIGDVSSGIINLELPKELGGYIALRVFEAKSGSKPEIRNGKLHFTVNVRLEGDVEELKYPYAHSRKDFIKKVENHIAMYLDQGIKNVFSKAQHELKSDPFNFRGKTKYYLSNWWEANYKAWDEEFQKSEIDVEVRVDIRRTGELT